MLSLLLLLLLPTLTIAIDPKSRTINPGLSAQLKTSATFFDRHTLLPSDSDWTYDFTTHPSFSSPVGAVLIADAASFPALTSLGITISLLKLAPCGMLPPHLHPRGTNAVVAITGNTTSWMVGENGVKIVKVDLSPMRMTVFPRGSLHGMQNNDCTPALLVSALNSDDAGTLNILPALWGMPKDIIQAGFGKAIDVDAVGRDIPPVGTGAIIGSEECKRRCGIKGGKGSA